jgi:hypothetical protein
LLWIGLALRNMPRKEREFHIVTEAVSALVMAPYFLWLSQQLPAPHKELLILSAVAMIAVDGYLLTQYDKW